MVVELYANKRCFLDTNVFIYYIEENPLFKAVNEIFASAESGLIEASTSELTLMEVLVHPLRIGRIDLAEQYEEILTDNSSVTMLPITSLVLRIAASLRANSKIRTPDAIQLATALQNGCEIFVTSDQKLPVPKGIEKLVISSASNSR